MVKHSQRLVPGFSRQTLSLIKAVNTHISASLQPGVGSRHFTKYGSFTNNIQNIVFYLE